MDTWMTSSQTPQIASHWGVNPERHKKLFPMDIAMIARLREVVAQASEAFEGFDYARALQDTEEAFWEFCDHYLEMVKSRSYSEEDTPGRRSALAALSIVLKTFLRLFAPFLPYIDVGHALRGAALRC